ncbi:MULTISPECIES: hypothetical protein [unclassified Streptomyces]|uniref:hypothetical protein n=1 Tax=unclassified Streptomyces TaxID=2593676 RepID=UPI001318DBA8|nr:MULTISPECIES: hypothetical protein [unclassified Streptomyces]QHC32736.1 hypothetical protein GR129_32145 [Streptomyces sp. HF10]WKE68186.1 hypothetical protein QHG49_03700 [Streptomyces sp. WP-1]
MRSGRRRHGGFSGVVVLPGEARRLARAVTSEDIGRGSGRGSKGSENLAGYDNLTR